MLIMFFTDTPSTVIFTLSLHTALPISWKCSRWTPTPLVSADSTASPACRTTAVTSSCRARQRSSAVCRSRRSEEHTSELQSRQYLEYRLLLGKKINLTLVMCNVDYFVS